MSEELKFDAERWCRTMAKAHWYRNEHDISSTFRTVAEEIDNLRARVARLEEALLEMLPPEHGEYGGPLVEMVARYEDGSPTERITPMSTKMHIRHEAVARVRRTLEEK